MAASVASVLEVPLATVPELSHVQWLPVLAAYAEHHDLCLRISSAPPPGYAIACGTGPRGLEHAVVVKDGNMVHDPHYQRAGLLNVHHFVSFIPCGW